MFLFSWSMKISLIQQLAAFYKAGLFFNETDCEKIFLLSKLQISHYLIQKSSSGKTLFYAIE